MGLTLNRDRYRVDLPGLQALCELNYWRLSRLLPQMRSAEQGSRIVLGRDEQSQTALMLRVLESCPYTSTLEVREEVPGLSLGSAALLVRVYHDARMAEVVEDEQGRAFLGRYPYPNPEMYQRDEKTQRNAFLAEWLNHCLVFGYDAQPLS